MTAPGSSKPAPRGDVRPFLDALAEAIAEQVLADPADSHEPQKCAAPPAKPAGRERRGAKNDQVQNR